MKETNLTDIIGERESNNEINNDNVFSLPNTDLNLPLKISTFMSEKEFDAFIKNVERLVRSSQEYKLWVSYVTENLGHTACAFTNESMNECSLEVHHHPVSLYVIVQTIINNDFLARGLEFSSFDVASKVIELHFQNKVGYIVLLSDLHKKFHSGFMNIPIELINGNYKFIINNYQINEVEFDRICKYCNVHLNDIKLKWGKDDYPGIKQEIEKKSIEPVAVKELIG